MTLRHSTLAATLATLVLAAPPAHAATTFEYLFDNGFPHGVSNDGNVIVGGSTSGGFVPFRWTQATGIVSLGRPQILGGAGTYAISADGTRIAAGIGSLDSSYTTQGLWTQATGWQELMPPPPADGGTVDGTYGSVWAMSGDGQTIVGLYNRPGKRAHASRWTEATSVVDLGSITDDRASRANAVNHDGTVIGGWAETPVGPWRPVVWVNGVLQTLTTFDQATNEGIGEVKGVSANGQDLVGFAKDLTTMRRGVARWTRNGNVFGAVEHLGYVDGTEPDFGLNYARGISDDGSFAVGYCTFDGTPFSTTGLVWSEETGVIDVVEWLASEGVFLDPNFAIQSLQSITPDGRHIIGFGQMLTSPFTRRCFRITRSGLVDVAPVATSRGLTFAAPSPNPSSSSTRLEFTLAEGARAEVAVFDAKGRRITTLLNDELPAGAHTVHWNGRTEDGREAPAGLYFARITTPAESATRRLVRAH